MSEQLELFDRPSELRWSEAIPLYWELEGKLLRGQGHDSVCRRIVEHLGRLFLHETSVYDVRSYRAARKIDNPEIRESSLNREQGRITRVINAFTEWKRIGRVGPYDFSALKVPTENAGELVPRADETRYQRNIVLSPEDFFKFCDYAHPRVRRICTLAVLTLLRRKDIRLLRDHNFNRALDTVSGTQSKTGNPYNISVPLTVRVIFHQANLDERDYICDFTNFRRLFHRAKMESGIFFQFRDLRRTGATALILDGFDIVTVQRLLGHATVNMTQTYLKPPAKASRDATRSLEQKFVTHIKIPDVSFKEN